MSGGHAFGHRRGGVLARAQRCGHHVGYARHGAAHNREHGPKRATLRAGRRRRTVRGQRGRARRRLQYHLADVRASQIAQPHRRTHRADRVRRDQQHADRHDRVRLGGDSCRRRSCESGEHVGLVDGRAHHVGIRAAAVAGQLHAVRVDGMGARHPVQQPTAGGLVARHGQGRHLLRRGGAARQRQQLLRRVPQRRAVADAVPALLRHEPVGEHQP